MDELLRGFQGPSQARTQPARNKSRSNETGGKKSSESRDFDRISEESKQSVPASKLNHQVELLTAVEAGMVLLNTLSQLKETLDTAIGDRELAIEQQALATEQQASAIKNQSTTATLYQLAVNDLQKASEKEQLNEMREEVNKMREEVNKMEDKVKEARSRVTSAQKEIAALLEGSSLKATSAEHIQYFITKATKEAKRWYQLVIPESIHGVQEKLDELKKRTIRSEEFLDNHRKLLKLAQGAAEMARTNEFLDYNTCVSMVYARQLP